MQECKQADQNTGGAVLEFPMRTVMHGKSRVLSAVSVCDNQQNFITGFSIVAVAQWARRRSSGHRMVEAEGSSRGGDLYQLFSAMILFQFLLGLMDFSDPVILCNRPNSCRQQNLKCFDKDNKDYPQVCFYERVAMTV